MATRGGWTVWLRTAGLAYALLASAAACSLLTSTSGLSGGAADAPDATTGAGTDGSTSDATAIDDASLAEAGSGCPAARGPAMVRVGSFCIDSTEVTQDQYRQFLNDRAGDAGGQPPQCAWNTVLSPRAQGGSDNAYDPASTPQRPVGQVDWCDAWTFCAWAGKRLCGKIGGGAVSFADYDDPAQSEWHSVCTQGGTRAYPYGNTYQASLCNGDDTVGTSRDVAASAGCVASVANVFDMSGNVWEWEDACDPACTSADDAGMCCRTRGGGYANSAANLSCKGTSTTSQGIAALATSIGIRCCADAK